MARSKDYQRCQASPIGQGLTLLELSTIYPGFSGKYHQDHIDHCHQDTSLSYHIDVSYEVVDVSFDLHVIESSQIPTPLSCSPVAAVGVRFWSHDAEVRYLLASAW